MTMFHNLWNLAVRFNSMPATLAGQLTLLVALAALIASTWKGGQLILKRLDQANQHSEWLELLWLEYCKQNGLTVTRELAERHMKINGNSKMSTEQKDQMYGKDRDK